MVHLDHLTQTDTSRGADDPQGPAEQPTQASDSFDAAVHSHARQQAERLHSIGNRREARSIRHFIAEHSTEPGECNSVTTPTLDGPTPTSGTVS